MKKLFIANWKMQLDNKESVNLAKNFSKKFKKSSDEIVLCPDFSSLQQVGQNIKSSAIKLGAQDVAAYDKGAYTGEVSAKSLKQLGVKYVIIGHSERRQYLKEDALILKMKIEQVLSVGLTAILCVGENLKERNSKKTHQVLKRQLEESLADLNISDDKKLVIAYEPVWAIGSGKAIVPSEAESAHVFIKGVLAEIIGQIPRVLYGGSVNSKNAADFLEWPNIDGLLLGGASLNLDEFSKIVNVK